tara:strand:- start:570 stop:1040 length:471 start_codon:yes stop_codon:yes gene_type:complete
MKKKLKLLGLALLLLGTGWVLSNSFQTDEAATVEIKRVIDGDTFIADIDGITETVRLIGIDAPELGDCYSTQATDQLKNQLYNRTIWIAEGDEPRDPYGRLLAYVFHEDGTFVNLEMVKAGAAEATRISPNVDYANLIGNAHDEAAFAQRGGWKTC